MQRRLLQQRPRSWYLLFAGIVLIAGITFAVVQITGRPDGGGTVASWNQGGVTHINVGHSPDVKPLFDELVKAFNSQSKDVQVAAASLELDRLIEASVRGDLVAVSPDASLVLNDRSEERRVGKECRL